VDAEGYLVGPPELVVEIAASSVSLDLQRKLRVYRRAGVREYLVWWTWDRQFDWFVLAEGEYRPNVADANGLLHSPHFPGLTLAVQALLAQDAATMLDSLQASLGTPAHAAFVAQLERNREGK
jgi:Uma2 family endonuclease